MISIMPESKMGGSPGARMRHFDYGQIYCKPWQYQVSNKHFIITGTCTCILCTSTQRQSTCYSSG